MEKNRFLILIIFIVAFATLTSDAQIETSNALQEPDLIAAPDVDNRELSQTNKDEVQSKDGKGPQKEGDYYKFFGDKISIRANEKFIYIKAGETTIVADSQGQVQIKAGGDLTLSTPGTLQLSAGKDIEMRAKGRVVTEGGGSRVGILP
jgi:hypothetical protein